MNAVSVEDTGQYPKVRITPILESLSEGWRRIGCGRQVSSLSAVVAYRSFA